VPDANKAPRKYVLHIAAQKLRRGERHLPLFVSMRIIFPAEGDALAVKGE
jgi:hypothetical protein